MAYDLYRVSLQASFQNYIYIRKFNFTVESFILIMYKFMYYFVAFLNSYFIINYFTV